MFLEIFEQDLNCLFKDNVRNTWLRRGGSKMPKRSKTGKVE